MQPADGGQRQQRYQQDDDEELRAEQHVIRIGAGDANPPASSGRAGLGRTHRPGQGSALDRDHLRWILQPHEPAPMTPSAQPRTSAWLVRWGPILPLLLAEVILSVLFC